jgi:hypothetical protein
METLQNEDMLVRFLQAARSVDVVLLNAAIAPERFEWLTIAVDRARELARLVETDFRVS